MQLQRKAFKWPRGTSRRVTRTREVGFFNKRTEEYQSYEYDEVSWEQNLEEVRDFVESLDPEYIISINEYRQAEYRIGDDHTLMIVVWYWIPDALV